MIFKLINVCVLALVSQEVSAIQTFSSTTTFDLSNLSVHNWGNEGAIAGVPLNHLSANTTVEANIALQQIRAFGFVPATTLTGTLSQNFTQIVGYTTTTPVFPAPPIPIYTPIYRSTDMNLSVSVAVPAFSFDTGVQTFAWNGSNYGFASTVDISFDAVITAAHSLSSGSEFLNASDSFTLHYSLSTNYWNINTNGYPAALGVSQGRQIYTPYSVNSLSPLTLSNGVSTNLAVVPEPSVLLSLISSCGLIFRRARPSILKCQTNK